MMAQFTWAYKLYELRAEFSGNNSVEGTSTSWKWWLPKAPQEQKLFFAILRAENEQGHAIALGVAYAQNADESDTHEEVGSPEDFLAIAQQYAREPLYDFMRRAISAQAALVDIDLSMDLDSPEPEVTFVEDNESSEPLEDSI